MAHMILVETKLADLGPLQARRLRSGALGFTTGFYQRLVEEARAYAVVDEEGQKQGYVLLVERPHVGHSHLTVVDFYLDPRYVDRYEDVLDQLRAQESPSAYLVRTDDCLLTSALLTRGLQVEPVALVMLPGESGGAQEAREHPAPAEEAELALVPLGPGGLPEVESLLHEEVGTPRSAQDVREELRTLAESGTAWVLKQQGRPLGVLAQATSDGEYDLLDFAVASGPEAALAWGLRAVTARMMDSRRRVAAVIEALDKVRHRVFRAAGYYTAAAYVVFYDPMARRPSVGVINLDQLQAMMTRGDSFRLIDVLGEEHWKAGHLPGAEWVDFRGLAREARRRFQPEETIVVYCNGFT